MGNLRNLKSAIIFVGLGIGSAALAQPSATPTPAANAAPPAVDPAAPSDPQAKICRTQEVTGSFVKKRKVCRTKAEWRRLADDHRSQAQDYVDHGRGGSNGD